MCTLPHLHTCMRARTHTHTIGENKDWGALMNILSLQMQWIENTSLHSNRWMNELWCRDKKTSNINKKHFNLIQIFLWQKHMSENKIQCLRQTNVAHLSCFNGLRSRCNHHVMFAYLRLSQPGKEDRWRMSQMACQWSSRKRLGPSPTRHAGRSANHDAVSPSRGKIHCKNDVR